MRRSILTSFVVIGAVLALVVGAGTFAVFTDSESISGTADAAILDFELSGDGTNTGTTEANNDETLDIGFNTTACAFDFFAPGDSCTIEIDLTRDAANILQQLAADLTVSAFSVNGVTDGGAGDEDDLIAASIGIDCDGDSASDWHVSWVFTDDVGSITHLPAATADSGQGIDVTVSLDLDAGNACQADTLGAIILTVLATQSAAPHSTTD